jgi:hypothetical protein
MAELSRQQLAQRARLVEWMRENELNISSLARATGDLYQNVQFMTDGKRRISQGFILRFRRAFGNEATDAIFTEFAPAPVAAQREPA